MKIGFIIPFLIFFAFSCKNDEASVEVLIKNHLDLQRKSETISISLAQIKPLVEKFGVEKLVVLEKESGNTLITQLVDVDTDGLMDELIFQVDLQPNQEKTYLIKGVQATIGSQPESEVSTFSRFVPERTDDYAWENDKVAFRTYGPKAQQMVEMGEPGGTLTSGMDAWLKRVDYPIINKWYKAYLSYSNAYHEDTGEGYDPYHVGKSRGIGGSGIWENDSLYVSKNFTSYKTIAEGPIRTLFELQYAPYEVEGKVIQETKRISLDLGSNLTRHEIILADAPKNIHIAMGISLHDKQGEVTAALENGWFRYWEPIDGSELGLGIVADPDMIQTFKDLRVDVADQSHLLVITKVYQEPIVYYAGFGWNKSGQFNSAQEWDKYLEEFSRKLSSPLEVELTLNQ